MLCRVAAGARLRDAGDAAELRRGRGHAGSPELDRPTCPCPSESGLRCALPPPAGGCRACLEGGGVDVRDAQGLEDGAGVALAQLPHLGAQPVPRALVPRPPRHPRAPSIRCRRTHYADAAQEREVALQAEHRLAAAAAAAVRAGRMACGWGGGVGGEEVGAERADAVQAPRKATATLHLVASRSTRLVDGRRVLPAQDVITDRMFRLILIAVTGTGT